MFKQSVVLHYYAAENVHICARLLYVNNSSLFKRVIENIQQNFTFIKGANEYNCKKQLFKNAINEYVQLNIQQPVSNINFDNV